MKPNQTTQIFNAPLIRQIYMENFEVSTGALVASKTYDIVQKHC